MKELNDLSPWIHPKAQNWFYALFRKTNLAMVIDDELQKPEGAISLDQMRMILAFGLLLGRNEMWPENERGTLKAILRRARQIAKAPPASSTGKPLTMAEHQSYNNTLEEFKLEIELLSRRLGMSNRQSAIKPPASWQPFWE
ncbi:MAG: hypothetical protein ACPIA2_19015 [Mariniblastus sp.]